MPGPGRPKGLPKTGGRKKGVPNRIPTARREALAAKGETPLEYMLRVMRDRLADESRRDDMAKAAAPYLHPKLANIGHTGADGGPVEIVVRWDDGNPGAATG